MIKKFVTTACRTIIVLMNAIASLSLLLFPDFSPTALHHSRQSFILLPLAIYCATASTTACTTALAIYCATARPTARPTACPTACPTAGTTARPTASTTARPTASTTALAIYCATARSYFLLS